MTVGDSNALTVACTSIAFAPASKIETVLLVLHIAIPQRSHKSQAVALCLPFDVTFTIRFHSAHEVRLLCSGNHK